MDTNTPDQKVSKTPTVAQLAEKEGDALTRSLLSAMPKLATLFENGERAVDAVMRASSREDALSKARESSGLTGLSKTTHGQQGQVYPTMDYAAAKRIRECTTYHSRCLQILAKNTVGLGHKSRKIKEHLMDLVDPETTWQQVMIQVALDYYEFGQGYLEISRDENDDIRGIQYRSAESVSVFVYSTDDGENTREEHHYMVRTGGGADVHVRKFSPNGEHSNDGVEDETFEDGIELIVFKQDEEDTDNPWYAVPHWVPALRQMELSGISTEFFYDFFYNRAVPSLAIFMVGADADEKSVKMVRNEFDTMGGPGRNYKTAIVGIPGDQVELVVEKLSAHENQHEVLERISAVTAEEILSIHGVPAAIAGISVPGRMSAANEFVNALMTFQLLQVGQAQVYFSDRLACTLGLDDSIELDETHFSPDSEQEGKLPDGNGFISLLDSVNVMMLDAASRMKDPALGPNRDVSGGLAENARGANASRNVSTSRGT